MPSGATVAVVSKGDGALVQLDGYRAWHFPCERDGTYLGYYPEDGSAAVSHLEAVRERGADYLVLPTTAFWWLEHYPELNQHLRNSYSVVAGEETCIVFALSEEAAAAPVAPATSPAPAAAGTATPIQELVHSLLPRDALLAVLAHESGPVALDGARVWTLPRKPGAGVLGHLEALVASGVEFLVIPSGELGWLEHHSDLLRELEHTHRLVTWQEHMCAIYELQAPAAPAPAQRKPESEPAVPDAPPSRSLIARIGGLLSRDGNGSRG